MIKLQSNRLLRACGAGLAAALLLALAPAGHAGSTNIFYKVTLNVASLDANSNAPFTLDFQLQSGSQNVTNSVFINGFTLTGGTLTGSAQTFGVETGNPTSGIGLTINPTTGFSEWEQTFSSSMTQISFIVNQTVVPENVTTGSAANDQFQVFIDDANTSDGYVPTTAPGSPGPDYLVDSVITGNAETVSNIGAFNSTSSPDPGVTTAVAVPEPGSAVLLLCGAIGVVARRRRR